MSGAPPPVTSRYSHQLPGVYGQFGAGAGVHAFYLQSTLTPAHLDWVSLISDIRGSERWPVRDLFQRDVDNDRISESLLPYLQDTRKIKFFNPLTLTLLPIRDDVVLDKMPKVVDSSMSDAGSDWIALERTGYYRIRWVRESRQYALLEWNDTTTKLVAIDGQHRLSALKRMWKDSNSPAYRDFATWHIPVVIVSFRAGPTRKEPPNVLEVVRSIFVYVNTEAKQVNRARQILLSDESINAVCTQALVQLAHQNDLEPPEKRDMRRLPLLFYDWRGEESEKQRIHAPAAAKNIEEVHDWFEHYLLGDDFSDEQETALGVDPSNQLHGVFHDHKLDHADSEKVRKLAHQDLLPAICHLLENFGPYRSYADDLRALEREHEESARSDIARHAFYELRFGTNLAPEAIQAEVDDACEAIKDRIEQLKRDHLHPPLGRDIGMRGVVGAFGELRCSLGYPPWTEYAKWFTAALNELYNHDWIDLRPRARKREFLLHVVVDHNDEVVNYRLEQAAAALGVHVQLLVMAYGQPIPSEWPDDGRALEEDLLYRLETAILRGYRKQVRPALKLEYPDGGKPLTEAVNAKAGELAGRHIRRLVQHLKKIHKQRHDE